MGGILPEEASAIAFFVIGGICIMLFTSHLIAAITKGMKIDEGEKFKNTGTYLIIGISATIFSLILALLDLGGLTGSIWALFIKIAGSIALLASILFMAASFTTGMVLRPVKIPGWAVALFWVFNLIYLIAGIIFIIIGVDKVNKK